MLKETRRGGLAPEVSEKNKEIPRQRDLHCAMTAAHCTYSALQ